MINIKQADLDDLPRLAPLFDAYRQFYGQPADLPGALRFLEDRLTMQESIVFLCEEDAAAIGFTQLYPIFSSVSMQRTWLLNDLFVDPRSRKKGAGKGLLEAAADWGNKTGAAWLLLSTATDNFSAQSLYEKCGWDRVSDIYYEYRIR